MRFAFVHVFCVFYVAGVFFSEKFDEMFNILALVYCIYIMHNFFYLDFTI